MTDVAQAIVNGEEEGEASTTGDKAVDIRDEAGNEDEGSQADSMNDNNDHNLTREGEVDECQAMETSDSVSNQFPEGSEAEAEAEDKDEDSNSKLEIIDNNTTTDGETITEDDTIPESTEMVSSSIKLEVEDGVNSQTEENQMEDEEEQSNNSAEESEPVLRNCNNVDAASASGANAKKQPSARNGGAAGRDSDPSDKPLLSGLLSRNEAGSSPKSTSSQGNCYSLNDGNEIAKGLEDHVDKLDNLLILKEKEWGAILRLKKHLEYALDQVKCTHRIGKLQDGASSSMTTTDLKACLSLMVGEKDVLNVAQQQIEESIESTETENESLQSIFPFKPQSQVKEEAGLDSKEDADATFTATAALQKLCERKRKAMDDLSPGRANRIRIVDVQSPTPSIQSKVIGNGRKGAIVDVQSIIQSHRNLTANQAFQYQKRCRKPPYSELVNMNPERQFSKTLEELLNLVEADKPLKETNATPVPASTSQSNKAVVLKPKNGRAPRQVGGNSLLASPMPSGSGALAKMLSPSTHSSTGTSRNSSDTSTTAPKFISKHLSADANLSLANLLATSKVETTKLNISKIKKERILRDDESSHVPSQQEAVPICQGCNLSRAQFVCAGCANQWYCSRECQVAAWDEHSEICSG